MDEFIPRPWLRNLNVIAFKSDRHEPRNSRVTAISINNDDPGAEGKPQDLPS